MKNKLTNTKTLENLTKSFQGECQAFALYQFFASKAKKEGYGQISEYFLETAFNEKEHAKVFYKLVAKNNEVPCTLENLEYAAAGEYNEGNVMYREYAKTARAEGFDDIANIYDAIADIENRHHERFVALANLIKNDKVFNSDKEEQWICTNCGNVVTGKNAPEKCPVCNHPKAYYKRLKKDY